MDNTNAKKSKFNAWYLLLIIPFIATLYPPFYGSVDPKFAGIPFFYWYQFLWVFLSALITYIVYKATHEKEEDA